MKILFLSKEIPPYVTIPGSMQRVILFSHYLIKKGHNVAIIGSGRRDNFHNGPIWWEEYLNEVKIFPLLPGKLLKYIDFKKQKSKDINTYDIKINKSISKNKNREEKKSIKDLIWRKIIYRLIRKIYNNLFFFGDEGILEIPSLKKHLSKIINNFNPDILIVSTPPHSWLRIVPWIKNQYPRLPIVIDFRDGWTSRGIFRAKSFIQRHCQDCIEKRVVLSADGLIFVSPGLKEFYLNKYNNLPYSEIVFNGYNESLWNSINGKREKTDFLIEKHRPCIIKYIGTINFEPSSNSSPINIFSSLESCLQKGLISSNDFVLSFTGFIFNTEVLDFFPILKPLIKINKPLSPYDALKEMKNSDFLLSIYSEKKGAEEVLSGKIFDYLRAEKPILAVTTNNCGIREFLEELDIGIWADINNLEDISKRIINILKIFKSNEWPNWCKENTISSSKISKYSREFQYEKFEKYIVRIVNNKKKE